MDEIIEGIVNAEKEAGNLPDNQTEEQTSKDVEEINEEICEDTLETPIDNIPVERSFNLLQTVFAWVCWVAGYLICRVYPVVVSPFGGFLFVVGLFSITAIILKKHGAVFPKISVVSAVSALVVSLALVLSSNETLHQVSYLFAVCAYAFFVYSATGNTLEKGFSDYVLVDFFKALFVLPFCNIGYMFKAMFHGKAAASGKAFGKTFLGLAIAFVPTVVVVVLLSYDDGFLKILDGIFSFNFADVFSHLFSIGLGIPIGMYLFGLFLSSVDGNAAEGFNAESVSKVSDSVKKMSKITALAASAPLLLVYAVFFVSQWKYYVSGFSGVLPDDISYANYAREGFFQLCMVSIINLVAIIVLSVFMRRDDNGNSVLLKILSVLFSTFTLVLISTAIAKMVMYINRFGLTPKRVYASWFMIVLAAVFIIVIIKQFVKRIKVIVASVGVCVVLFAALSLSNIDGLIAKYNVNCYLDGTFKTIDVGTLYELGDSATPEMVRLAKELDKRLGTDISTSVEEKADLTGAVNTEQWVYNSLSNYLRMSASRFETENNGIFSYTVQKYRAETALESIGAFD